MPLIGLLRMVDGGFSIRAGKAESEDPHFAFHHRGGCMVQVNPLTLTIR